MSAVIIYDQSGTPIGTSTNPLYISLTGSTVGTPDSAAPDSVVMMGGTYSSADPTYDDGDVALIRVNSKGEVAVNLASSLDSDFDSINVDKMGKGSVTTAHNAITATATSTEVDCRGYNAILIEATISVAAKNWIFKVQGCVVSGGTFIDCYEQANTGVMTLMSYQTNVSKIFIFKGIPDYVKIVATEDEDGATVTVKVQPLNV